MSLKIYFFNISFLYLYLFELAVYFIIITYTYSTKRIYGMEMDLKANETNVMQHILP